MRTTLIAVIAAALVAGGAVHLIDRARAQRLQPGNSSTEAGFARDMQVHHLQGVDLAMLVRDRTMDQGVRGLAFDILTTQAHQAGQLYGWLSAWGLNQLGSDPQMTWMGHAHRGAGALMPGMATREQIAELTAASGVDAERIFLRLMIAHHRGAIDMSNAALERTTHPLVVAFARAVLASQQSEIDLMTKMLADREKR